MAYTLVASTIMKKKKKKVWQYKTTGKQILKVCNNFLQHLTHFYNEIGNEIKQEE